MKKAPDIQHSPNKLLFDDERMFEFIFKAYYPRLMAFARKFISDRTVAEDVVQEVFLKIWEKKRELEEETFHSYVFTLVRNACLNHLKHQQIVNNHQAELEKTADSESLYYADFFSDPFHQTIFNEIQNEIKLAMLELPDQTRNVFQLSRFEGLKNKEIAEKLNISLRTVEKHNSRALEKLKAHLASHYFYAIIILDLLRELNN